MNYFWYFHVINESNFEEALIRVCTRSGKTVTLAGNRFYEQFFVNCVFLPTMNTDFRPS